MSRGYEAGDPVVSDVDGFTPVDNGTDPRFDAVPRIIDSMSEL